MLILASIIAISGSLIALVFSFILINKTRKKKPKLVKISNQEWKFEIYITDWGNGLDTYEIHRPAKKTTNHLPKEKITYSQKNVAYTQMSSYG